MALIKCPECGKKISNKAVSCPNCGIPISDADLEVTQKLKSKNKKHINSSMILSIISLIISFTFVLSPFGIVLAIVSSILSIVSKNKKKHSFILPLISLIVSILLSIILLLMSIGVIVIPAEVRTTLSNIVITNVTTTEQVNLTKDNFNYYFNYNSYCTDYSESKNNVSLYGYSLGTDYYCSCNLHIEISPKNDCQIDNGSVTFVVYTTWDIDGVNGNEFTIEIPKDGVTEKVYSCSDKTYFSKANNLITPFVSSLNGTITTDITQEITLDDILSFFVDEMDS